MTRLNPSPKCPRRIDILLDENSLLVFRIRCPAALLLRIAMLALATAFLLQAIEASGQAQDGAAMLKAIENGLVSSIEKAERSVVAIARVPKNRDANSNRAQLGPLSLDIVPALEDPFRDPDYVPTFFGSGVIISTDGFIVTCAHVLDDPRENDYFVWLDKRSYSARVIGPPTKAVTKASDGFSDLAVIKIDAQNLIPIEFGDTEKLRRGKFVVALGNPEAIGRDGHASASWGIISNLSRIAPGSISAADTPETVHQFGTLIQTDAKLNFGTSGGALIDLSGKMIGLTTSLSARTGVESSAGYAIAADKLFRRVVASLRLGRLPEFGFLGIQPEELHTQEIERGFVGAKVSVVLPGLPGDQAGLKAQDIIIEVDQHAIHNRNDLFRELSMIAAGQSVQLTVLRYRSGLRSPSKVKLTAELSKKPIQNSRLNYRELPSRVWNGMTVEYITAIPSDLTRFGVWRGRRGAPQIAVLSVEPDSPAWKAGIRAGNGIASVDDMTIASPEQFYKAVSEAGATVTIRFLRNDGSSAKARLTPALARTVIELKTADE